MNQFNNDSPDKVIIINRETDNDIPRGHLLIDHIDVRPEMQRRSLAKPIGEIIKKLPSENESEYENRKLKNLTEDIYVSRYKEMLKLSEPPPVTVYKIKIGEELVLVDGFNRLLASKNAGRKTIPAIVIEGTEIEAIRASCRAHGYYRLRLNNKEKKCAFLVYYNSLTEEERNKLTDTDIGAILGFPDHSGVGNYRPKDQEQTPEINSKKQKRKRKRNTKADAEYVDLWKDAGIPKYSGSQISEKQNQLTNPIDQEYTLSECAEETEIKESELDQKEIYTLSKWKEDTGFDKSELDRWVGAINRNGQAIIQGPPGTGKTYIAERLARYLIGGGDGFQELVQFHPAYSYEDFMQGIRPQTKEGKLTYEMVQGRFLEFCEKAELCKDKDKDLCVLVIDEINRANLSQVFGELMYLLEYRDKKIPLAGSSKPLAGSNEPLAGSRETFGIPKNVRIIGTMNTADRSIALIDFALRRRFAFITLSPEYKVLKDYHKKKETGFPVDKLSQILEQLNREINDPHYQLGISFFLRENLIAEIEDIWLMEIEPYLEEYFFDQRDKVEKFRWEKIKTTIAQ